MLGTNTSPNFLWKVRFKINTPDAGLNFLLQIAEQTEAAAITAVTDIAGRLRALMPSTCEIFACTISKSNTRRDSRMIPGAIGPGLYLQSGVSPAATVYNQATDVFLIRFEDADGSGVSMKIGPIPDTEISAGDAAHVPAAVTDGSAAPAALGAQPITFATEFTQLMQAICKYTHHVETKNNAPGGNYTFSAYTKANFKRVAKKKGGRVFVK
jgi:hypothetical protein